MDLLKLQDSPAAFRNALVIDTDRRPLPFHECVDPWQAADFAALDAGWRRAVMGAGVESKYQRAWLERPRGHSKTQDIAVMAAWALFASRRRLSLIGCAADLDQARLLRDAIGRLAHVNPWLTKILEIQNTRILNPNTGSTLEIIASDAKSSYGLTPDGIICDEVVHWKSRDLWDSMLSSAAKRSTCMLVVISNAGIMDDEWVWNTREAVRKDDGWYFSRLERPCASWIDADLLAEQERLLPGVAFRRLWLNEWTTGGGDALPEELIDFAFDDSLTPMTGAAAGWEFVAGFDAGIVRDASAVVVLGIRRPHSGHGHLRLAATRIWKPTERRRVNLQEVEDHLVDLHDRFELRRINYDPWQAAHLASRLQSAGVGKLTSRRDRKAGLPMVEVPPTGQNQQRMASALLEAFNDRRVQLFPDPDLRRDLRKLRVQERQGTGFRLVSPHDEHGHGDMATAFELALLAATELASRRLVYAGAVSDYDLDPDASRWEHEQAAFRYRQQRFADEQHSMRDSDDTMETYHRWLKQHGRG